MAGAQIPDNLTPYAGGETGPVVGGRRTSNTPKGIPADDLHNAPSARGRTMPREDIEPYAPKAQGTSASREDSNQVGDENTARGIKGGMVDTGQMTNNSSLDVPGDLTPYANETRTSAARRDADGC